MKIETNRAESGTGSPLVRLLGSWMVLSLLLVLCFFEAPRAQTIRNVQLRIGEAAVMQVRGTVQLVSAIMPTSSPRTVLVGQQIVAGDRLKSASDGYALLSLVDGSTIELHANTDLEVLDFSGGVRELFRLWLGKVRLKIRKLVGAPNPYQMHTPIATIGVRGTEFENDVEPNSVTTVRVFEGLVAVKNNQLATDEVLVPGGQEVTLYPLRPPDPPVRFEQVVAENFTRETIEEYPLLRKFLAFPDTHLDILDNPAYASHIVKPSGRFYFYPVWSQSLMLPEISPINPLSQFTDVDALFATDERRLGGFSARGSYAAPIGDWIVAGLYEYRDVSQDFSFHINRRIPSAFGGEVSIEQVGSSLYAPNLSSDSGAHRTMVLAARKFAGQTLAFSYDWTHSRGSADTLYQFRPGGFLLTSEKSLTSFRTDSRKLSVGYHRESDSLGSLALFYKTGFLSGSSGQNLHEFNGQPAPLAQFESSGNTQETGLKWRKGLSRNLFLGVFGSLSRTNLDQGILDFRMADSERQTVLWAPSLGAGLGMNWRNRIFAALDYQFSHFSESSRRRDLINGDMVGNERGSRQDQALHGWVQVQLPHSFFVGGGFTSYWSSDTYRGRYSFDSLGQRADSSGQPQGPSLFQNTNLHIDQLGVSGGRRFGEILFFEYQVTKTLGPVFRPLSHNLLLRIAF